MNVISDLADGAAPAAPASNTPNIPEGPLKVLRGIANGQIPGAVIPKDAPKMNSDLKPEDLQGLGVGFYVPHSEGLVGVLFDPKQVSEKMLQGMDKAGKLAESLPSITSLLGDSATDGAPEGGEAAVEGSTEQGAGAATTPVLPRPSPAGVQTKLAGERLQNLDANTEPSKRKIPGGGSVLNGLIARAV